ncbi:hypothetical protein Taro_005750 [Colocasia esculenta]|uniref:Uncharacterized protein n=1 Tax=Colocasia esculenta TaxID=4460 RepID=A0A843TU05_COLES|nr:hypothetical protein [Colocasia esculenta]
MPEAALKDVRYNGVQRDCFDNREKLFSIQFDGRQIHVEKRRPPSSSAAQESSKLQDEGGTSQLQPSRQ